MAHTIRHLSWISPWTRVAARRTNATSAFALTAALGFGVLFTGAATWAGTTPTVRVLARILMLYLANARG
jgi:hypothetical protein